MPLTRSARANGMACILLLFSLAFMLGLPVLDHALNFAVGHGTLDSWLLWAPVVCLASSLTGFLCLRTPRLPVPVAILAALCSTVLLSVYSLLLSLLIGIALAFSGAPGYDLM